MQSYKKENKVLSNYCSKKFPFKLLNYSKVKLLYFKILLTERS